MSSDVRIIYMRDRSPWPSRPGLQSPDNLLYEAGAEYRQVTLTRAQMAELYWRAKELSFAVDYDMSAAAGGASVSQSGTFTLTVPSIAVDVWGTESPSAIDNPTDIIVAEKTLTSTGGYLSGGPGVRGFAVSDFFNVDDSDGTGPDLDTANITITLTLTLVLDRKPDGSGFAIYLEPVILAGASATEDAGTNYANEEHEWVASVGGGETVTLHLTGASPTVAMDETVTTNSGGSGASASVSVSNARITIGEYWTYGGAISSSTGLPV